MYYAKRNEVVGKAAIIHNGVMATVLLHYNSFYENLHEIYSLKGIFINEGILENQLESTLFIDKATNSILPLRN
jgi:hypothetical protein